jgi:hypothetical protein
MNTRSLSMRFATTALALALTAGAPAAEVRDFETPQAAADAMVDAMGSDGFDAVLSLLDRDFEDELLGGDRITAKENMRRVHEAATSFHGLRAEGDDRRIMLIGPRVWPLPFPILRVDGRWRFDTEAGIEETVNRRIGRNELNAIAVARAYVAAQREYASADRDGDEVREFATRISSRPGRRDGLYWEVDDGEPPSPFGPLVADARAYLEGREPGDPYRGYYFKVLSRQGLNPPGRPGRLPGGLRQLGHRDLRRQSPGQGAAEGPRREHRADRGRHGGVQPRRDLERGRGLRP